MSKVIEFTANNVKPFSEWLKKFILIEKSLLLEIDVQNKCFVAKTYDKEKGKELINGLKKLQYKYESIGDVRGKGLMVAIELVEDRETEKPDKKLRDEIIQNAFKKGLLLLGCGESSIRFSPALTITSSQINICLSILDDILK